MHVRKIYYFNVTLTFRMTGILCAPFNQNYAPVHTQLPVTVRRGLQWRPLAQQHSAFWNKCSMKLCFVYVISAYTQIKCPSVLL